MLYRYKQAEYHPAWKEKLGYIRVWNRKINPKHHKTEAKTSVLFFTFVQARLIKEMMGLIGAGNNPQVLMTVAVAVAIEEASK